MAENEDENEENVVPIRKPGEPNIVAEVGGPPDESGFTLAVYGEDLVPTDVTRLFGVEPTSSFARGHRRKPNSRPMPHGAWFFEARARRPEGPEEVARSVLMRLALPQERWAEVRSRYQAQFRVALHMSGFNQDFTFSASTLQLIAATGLDVYFDLYPDGDG